MDFAVPELGEGVYEAEFVSWLVQPGDMVKRGQNLMEVLTDKATMEVPSPFAGKVTALNAEPGQTIKVGDIVLTYQSSDKKGEDEKPAAEERPMQAQPSTGAVDFARQGNGRSAAALSVKAAPSVRLMARQLGVDLNNLQGSGPGGRILIGDLSAQMQPSDGPRKPPQPKPDYGTPGTKIKLIGVRRKIGEQMVKSKTTIPHYGYVDECDVTNLVGLRDSLKQPAAQAGVRLTYLAFIAKAVVAALKEVPLVNATLNDNDEIVLHDKYNIGLAVAAPQGLIVPVIHDADQKDLFAIAKEIDRLSGNARTGKIKREDLQDGTFTITSIGNIGGLFSTPVINHPEVGILGIGKIVKRPMYDEAGNIRPADMLYLSFSFDHRVVDGAVGAAFGNAVIGQLRHPARMLVAK